MAYEPSVATDYTPGWAQGRRVSASRFNQLLDDAEDLYRALVNADPSAAAECRADFGADLEQHLMDIDVNDPLESGLPVTYDQFADAQTVHTAEDECAMCECFCDADSGECDCCTCDAGVEEGSEYDVSGTESDEDESECEDMDSGEDSSEDEDEDECDEDPEHPGYERTCRITDVHGVEWVGYHNEATGVSFYHDPVSGRSEWYCPPHDRCDQPW